MATTHQYKQVMDQSENPFASMIPSQKIAIIPAFTLESGVTLYNVPVAYTTRGVLSPHRDNAMVICHALSGSAGVSDWWGPMLGGPGRAFDVSRFFVVCINCLGSPYGTASPVTAVDGDPSKGHYGPEFPLTTIRDDVQLSKMLLDDLGVKQIAAVIGGSMGGMLVLEFAYLGKDYVRTIVPIATSARHSAWCISWGEAQRQSIYSDPKYDDGYYSFSDPPTNGLGAARMQALLTYRSRDSFESRFGRSTPDAAKVRKAGMNGAPGSTQTSSGRPTTPGHEHFAVHNEGHRNAGTPRSIPASPSVEKSNGLEMIDPQFHGPAARREQKAPHYFSAQTYLRYQRDKFNARFDANCYIAVSRKLDTHDISYHSTLPPSSSPEDSVHDALQQIEQPTLVLGIESDGLFKFSEQEEIARGIQNSRLERIESTEGHDAFLLQFKQVNDYVLGFLKQHLKEIWEREALLDVDAEGNPKDGSGSIQGEVGVGKLSKSSVFGEAEVEDITAW